jgi:mannosyltransferase
LPNCSEPPNPINFTPQMELLHNVSHLESQKRQVRPRGNSLYWWIGWALAGVSVCAAVAACGLNESLWLDELHTSWAIAGTFEELPERSQQGNQTPLYAYVLKIWTLGLGKLGVLSRGPEGVVGTEWSIRLPSWLAYCLSIFLFYGVVWRGLIYKVSPSGASPGSATRPGFLAGLICLALCLLYFGLERIQLFYATEARVYSLVQLLSFVGWLLVFVQYSSREEQAKSTRDVALLVAWFGVALLLVHLHLVTIIVVAWQATVLSLAWLRNHKRSPERLVWFIGLALASVCVCLPLVWDYLFVWERRQQWTRFAGDASWTALANQFPTTELLVPAALAYGLDSMLGKLRRSLAAGEVQNRDWPVLLGWTVAWLGPLLTAWLLTWLEVAPLMHRRYLLVSAIPMVMLAAQLLVRIRYRTLACAAIGVSAVWLINVQPTLELWRNGQLVGTQRGEYWREVTQWVQTHYVDGDQEW